LCSSLRQKANSWHVRLLLVPLLFEYLRPLVQFSPKDCSCSYLGARTVRLLLVQVAPKDNSCSSSYLAAHTTAPLVRYLAAHTAAPLVHVAPMDAATRSTTARPDRSEGKLLGVSYLAACAALLMKLLFVQSKALVQLTLKESGNSVGYCSCIQLFFLESAPLQDISRKNDSRRHKFQSESRRP
jgi:hypothetical protein